jgi:hypothetical protein
MEVAGSQPDGAMVAKPARGVRQGDVDRAADAILARGERPTVERIRALLGTGSPNTLGPLIDTWYRTLSARVAGMQHAAGAEGRVPTAAVNAFNLLWDTALAEARTTVQAELAATREQLTHDRAAVAEDQRVLEATRAALEQASQTARDRNRELEEQVVAGQQQLRREQQMAAAAGERIGALQQELAQAQREARVQAAAHEEQRARDVERTAANERRLLADIDRARGEARAAQDELRRAHAQREEQLRTANAERVQLQERIDDLATAAAHREEELARAEGALQRATQLEASLRELADTAQARSEDLRAALDSERAGSAQMRRQAQPGTPLRRKRGAAGGGAASTPTRAGRKR